MSETDTLTKDIVVTRLFNVPVEQVWKAWTDSEQVKRWWGPTGFTSPFAKMDFREGGKSLVCMRAPGFGDLYNTWTYQKIVPMQRIEFIMEFADEQGNFVKPVSIGLPEDTPESVRHVVTFKPIGYRQTEMTVTEYGYTSSEVYERSKLGLEQCLDKMAANFFEEE